MVIPPPNVTGVLHMGHMLNNTIQDVLVRRARMQGKETCWVPGTDHASIATEAKVVKMLKDQGIEKKDIGREKFLEHAWAWTDKYGGTILKQLRRLGASCDWDRTRFTLEESLSEAVIKVFVDLHQKGLVYRGIRMVNWDPVGGTAISDDEVIYKQVNGKLYYVNYAIEGEAGHVTVATTRPETILGDVAVCVNPNDERFKHLHGKRVLVPLLNRSVPVIADEYVDMEFGTGCLKITPAHDINDYEIGLRHKLPVIDVLNDDGTMSQEAQLYVGQDRFKVRKQIAKDLEAAGQIEKIEDYTNNVGFSERTDAVIEPKLSLQWFLKMEQLAKPALDAVMTDEVQFHPPKFKNMYRSWMENVRDWCISRQLWWGHRIPAYYLPNGEYVVAETAEEALQLARALPNQEGLQPEDLRQDDDVLDTWFSSWLWPISVFDGFKDPENAEIQYYYPTNDLVTAPEIMFFWVARMIMAGYEWRGKLPFKNVYYTGIVRDAQGRKMSKSLGNSPDPIDLIGQYGADGVRTGMLFSSPAGNDLLFDVKLCEQGRNFANKIWNAFRLVKGWEVADVAQPAENVLALDFMRNGFNRALAEVEDHFDKFRVSDALMAVYKLIWNDFCSWFLEMVKPPYGQPIDRATYEGVIALLEDHMRLLHPFMPFISEEIWNTIQPRSERDCLCVAQWPAGGAFDEALLANAQKAFDTISQLRNLRNSKGLSPKQALALTVKTTQPAFYEQWGAVVQKLAAISSIDFAQEAVQGAICIVMNDQELFVPMEGAVNVEQEREELSKELAYTKGFLEKVRKKLSNERFVSNAPEQVVAVERKKMADAEAKIKALEESLARL